jgi:hypothetical protein
MKPPQQILYLIKNKYLLIVMNKLYILDFLLSSVFAGINIKYTKTNDYKILVGIIWSIFIISSLLINNSLTVYFISSIIIGFSILAIYIILKIPINTNLNIVFWILYFISALVLTFIVFSKKMFFANVYNESLMGAKGDDGKIGNKGDSYILKTYPEKCYNDLILTVENYLVQNMKINDIDYDPYEYQLKNLYFKQLLKRICLSQEFNDYVLFGKINSYTSDTKKYNNNICNYTGKTLSSGRTLGSGRTWGDTDEECETDRYGHDYQKTSRNVRSENNYNKIMKELKIVIIKWCKFILLNNDNEDNDLKEQLGYDISANINNLIPTTLFVNDKQHKVINNLREDMRYNNKTGRKFFDDYFLTDKYFDDFLSKNNNKRSPLNNQPEYRSFAKIENTLIENLDLGKPFNWGKSDKCGK